MFQISSCIESISTRADNTIKLVIGTQELPPEQAVEIFKLKGKLGWILFSENPLEAKDIPNEPATEFKNEKSPSQRLRNCLYVWWEKNTNRSKPFDEVWKEWCNKKCDEIKEYLPK